MASSRARQALASAVAAALFAGPAWSAGGHHAVDDAAVLDPGACKTEGWASRLRGGAQVLHGGASCRVGAFELGASAERERAEGTAQTGWSLQAKSATELGAGWSAAVLADASWQARGTPRLSGVALVALVTWTVREDVRLHANLGRDVMRGGANKTRAGASADWSFHPNWTVMSERYRQEDGHFARAGLSWSPIKGWQVDLSRARRLSGPGVSSWTLGLMREFD